MSISSNAKDIAIHFINSTNLKASKVLMSKTIIQAKSLLSDGFTKEEIIKTIDYIVNVKKINLYSFGYINAAISSILHEVLKHEASLSTKDTEKQITVFIEASRNEVQKHDQSTNRNKSKINGFGIQPRLGEKLDFDMFERPQ